MILTTESGSCGLLSRRAKRRRISHSSGAGGVGWRSTCYVGGEGAWDKGEVRAAIGSIRNQFHDDDLPTLIELEDMDEDQVVEMHEERVFVQQMRWVQVGHVQLRKATVDYYRAVTQSTEWLDRDLVGLAELRRFEDNLRRRVGARLR